jgi:hypothetical protein
MDPVGDLSLFDESLDAFDLEGRQAAEGKTGPVNCFADGVLDRRARSAEIDRLFNGHGDPPGETTSKALEMAALDYLCRPVRGETNMGVRWHRTGGRCRDARLTPATRVPRDRRSHHLTGDTFKAPWGPDIHAQLLSWAIARPTSLPHETKASSSARSGPFSVMPGGAFRRRGGSLLLRKKEVRRRPNQSGTNSPLSDAAATRTRGPRPRGRPGSPQLHTPRLSTTRHALRLCCGRAQSPSSCAS